MGDQLQDLWNFNDLTGTERRFRSLLAHETSADRQAELLTQLARIEGLRGNFDDGEKLILRAEAVSTSPVVRIRVDLERGRLLGSSGKPEPALPRFEDAFAVALDAGAYFLAVDAAHMAALVAPDHDRFVAWTQRGIELAEVQAEAHSWLGPLLNNLGWQLFDAGDLAGALDAFRRALERRLADPENQSAIEVARYAVGKTLRELGRPEEAVSLLEQAVGWASDVGEPDGWFSEELALEYAAIGRLADAGRQAAIALQLLPAADPSFDSDPERVDRLRSIAAAAPGS